MLRWSVLFPVFSMLLSNTYSQGAGKFTLDGTVIGRNSGKLYLVYTTKSEHITDSAEIINGRFEFNGFLDEPTKAELTDNLQLRKAGYGNYLSDFYLEPGLIKLATTVGHFAEAKLTGSKTNEEYQQLTRYINPIFKKILKLQNQIKADSNKAAMFSDTLRLYSTPMKKYLMDFVAGNPDSYNAILATQRLLWLEVSPDSVLAVFNLLTAGIKNTIAAKELKGALVAEIGSSIGHVAPEFKRKDINGKLIWLSSFKGQYVLLDFWASWCVPCRAQTPHVKRLYQKYSDRGLKVIAISCDSKYDAWQKAVQKDNIESFVNVLSFTDSDMDFLKRHDNVGEASFKGELRKKFNLMPIPVYILLDRKGIIIGRYGGSEKDSAEMLDKKLTEIFDNG